MVSFVWQHMKKDPPNNAICNTCLRKFSYSGTTSSLGYHLRTHGIWKKKISAKNTMMNYVLKPVKDLNYLALWVVIKDFKPLSFFEGDGIKAFLKALKPDWEPPVRQTISKMLLKEFESGITKLRKYVNNLPETTIFAITFDGWTSIATDGYIGLSLHFIDASWNLKKIVPFLKKITGPHSGEAIAALIKKELIEWKIVDRISAAVIDNARNEIAAVRELTYTHLPCAAHTLNLVVTNSLDSIAPLLKTCKKIIGHFNHSPSACDRLKQYQLIDPPLNTKEEFLLPIQDVCTRWNSTYYSIKRLLQIKDSIINFFAKDNDNEHKLDSTEWNRLEILRQLLKPFNRSTQVLSEDKYPSLASYYAVYRGLTKHLSSKDWKKQSSTIGLVAEKLLSGLTVRFQTQKEKRVWNIAPLLDARFKSLDWVMEDEAAKKDLKELFEKYKQKENPQNPNSPQNGPLKKKKKMDDILELAGSKKYEGDEFEQYLACPGISSTENPLLWWKQHETQFPVIAKIARKYLCIPATSAPTKRLFSDCGNVMTKKRASMHPATLEQLIVLYENSELIEQLIE